MLLLGSWLYTHTFTTPSPQTVAYISPCAVGKYNIFNWDGVMELHERDVFVRAE